MVYIVPLPQVDGHLWEEQVWILNGQSTVTKAFVFKSATTKPFNELWEEESLGSAARPSPPLPLGGHGQRWWAESEGCAFLRLINLLWGILPPVWMHPVLSTFTHQAQVWYQPVKLVELTDNTLVESYPYANEASPTHLLVKPLMYSCEQEDSPPC